MDDFKYYITEFKCLKAVLSLTFLEVNNGDTCS